VLWLYPGTTGETRGQVEPMGVREDLRGIGLGRAILSEGLRRLHRLGATGAFVETARYRGPALALHESIGFRVLHDVWICRKDYTVA
jgi:GNAT superfamily N-acetyltransferase